MSKTTPAVPIPIAITFNGSPAGVSDGLTVVWEGGDETGVFGRETNVADWL